MRLSIIVPNYNGASFFAELLDTLRSLTSDASDTPGSTEVIVVDDASTDESWSILNERYGGDFKLLRNDSNAGFSRTVNRGIREAEGDFVALVNTDIICSTDIFGELLKYLEEGGDSSRKTFSVSPLIFNKALNEVENYTALIYNRGVLWLKRMRIDTLNTKTYDKAVICGAFVICRGDLLRQLGGLDEDYSPFYWEDIDLGLRAERLGYENRVVANLRVIHNHSRSISPKYSDRDKRHIMLRNQIRISLKHRDHLGLPGSQYLYLFARGLKEVLTGDLPLALSYMRGGFGSY